MSDYLISKAQLAQNARLEMTQAELKLYDQLQAAKAELKAIKSRVDSTADQTTLIKDMQEQLAVAEKTAADLRLLNKQVEEDLAEAEGRIEALKGDVDGLTAERNELEEKASDLEKENEQLTTKLAKAEKDVEELLAKE